MGHSASHLHGTAIDVTTGRPMKQVLMRVKNTNGQTVKQIVVDGSYQISLLPGDYSLHLSRSGYVSSVQAATTEAGLDIRENLLMSPSLNGNKLRAVLTWGSSPRDLDVYMHTAKNSGACVVSWRNMACHDNSVSMDIDAMDSHGPETITIKRWENGKYVYKVKRFSDDGNILTSGAKVEVFGARNSDRKTFYIGRHGKVEGQTWTVFTISGPNHEVREYDPLRRKSLLAAGPHDGATLSQLSSLGWRVCSKKSFSPGGLPIQQIENACNGQNLVMACGRTGENRLVKTASGPRSAVFTSCNGRSACATANGVSWYWHGSWSFGFARQGSTVNRHSCDVGNGATSGMCVHTSGGRTSNGYRCGSHYAGSNSWTWYILH